MPKDGLSMRLEGADAFGKLLRETPKAIFNKALKESSRAAMRPVSTYAKRLLRGNKGDMPWSMGLLEKSIGLKVKAYKRGRKGGTIWVGVGPRSGFKQFVARPRVYKGGTGGIRTSVGSVRMQWANPTQYAHLVERGTKHSQAFPFMRRSYLAKGRSVPDQLAVKVRGKVPKIIAREARRAGVRKRR